MDFFVEASASAKVSGDTSGRFAEAIAHRYAAAAGHPPTLSPPLHVPGTPRGELPGPLVISPNSMTFPPMELASMALSSPPPRAKPSIAISIPPPSAPPAAPTHAFTPIPPADLSRLLADGALVIDIRPPTAYAYGRVRGALGLAAPSTLLRRPAFTLDRLAAMVGPPSARARFAAWAAAPLIVAYDADAATVLPGSSLHGLLAKFQASGCDPAKLRWVKGGFQAIWADHNAIVDTHLPEEDEGPDVPDVHVAAPTPALKDSGLLHARKLPMAAFTLSSTTSSRGTRTSPAPALPLSSASPKAARTTAINPFFDNIRQNLELSGTSSADAAVASSASRIPLRLSSTVLRRIDDLPLDWLRDIAHRAEREQRLGPDGPDTMSDDLARQFYAIELAEQKRLMGIMDHHSKQPHGAEPDAFPFGITAGFEKGQKNRYRNIWPFEHARVRLVQHAPGAPADEFDDYVNASYVQPLGTRKRYIATQGPLDATFADFWALVWEQNVHVVVMLTRLREGAQTKCGHYWADGVYGRLRVRAVESSGTPTEEEPAGGFFAQSPGARRAFRGGTIRRVLELTHEDYPRAGPRRVAQLQYLGWDDMNVPEDARGVLGLVRDVDTAVEEGERQRARANDHKAPSGGELDPKTGILRRALTPPVLLHCSAGIGRTGGFIALDAILDAIRSEVRSHSPEKRREVGEARKMHVDESRVKKSRPFDALMSESRRPPMKRLVSSTPTPTAGGRVPSDSAPDFVAELPASSFRAFSAAGPGRSPPHSPAHSPTTRRTEGAPPNGLSGGLLPAAQITARRPAARPVTGRSSSSGSGSGSGMSAASPATTPPLRQPRVLHQEGAPRALSAFNTPVRAVVEDMREQRMSLCQSLRQYVFVHNAILEGALQIVDEERAAR